MCSWPAHCLHKWPLCPRSVVGGGRCCFPSIFPSSCHLLSYRTQPLLSLSYLFIFLQSVCFISLHCSLFAILSDSSLHTQPPTQHYIKKRRKTFIRIWKPPSFSFASLILYSLAFSIVSFFAESPSTIFLIFTHVIQHWVIHSPHSVFVFWDLPLN